MSTEYTKFEDFDQFYDVVVDSPHEWQIYFGFDSNTILAVNKEAPDTKMEASISPYSFTEVYMMLIAVLEDV